MKKILFLSLAAAAFASCSQDEILDVIAPEAITFNQAFVNNATRAIDGTLNSENPSSFQVYGSVQGTGTGEGSVNIFSGVEVKKKGDSETLASNAVVYNNLWWYDGAYTQYWIKGNNYQFAAIVNGTATGFDKDSNNNNNMPTTISYNASEQKDLLYAEYEVEGYDNTNNGVVAFTFDHLLSKAQFTFVNNITTNTESIKYTYRVSDIKITNAYMNGTYNIADEEWAVVTTGENVRNEVAFGNISATDDSSADAIWVGAVGATASSTSHYQKLLIPNNYTDLVITCKIETLLNGIVVDTEETHTIKPVSVNLEAGKAYNFVISKGAPGEKIMFTVTEVNEWNPATGGTDVTL